MPLEVNGHVSITDDLGNVLLDKDNAVHPQNVARVIARSLSNESNYFVHRIAFGNGGTTVDAAFTITYKTPNDGQPPDVRTWDSRIYNETYSEIIDEGNLSLNSLLGTDPGSAGPNAGTRAGGGADPSGDPASIPHVSGPGVHSNELGLTSEVVITSVINPGEPTGQFATDSGTDIESSFSFDEIGLYTLGAPASDSNGTHDIDVGNRNSEDDTGLLANTQYSFFIAVDGGTAVEIIFTTDSGGGSGAGGFFTYGDLAEALNVGSTWGMVASPLPNATVDITDNTENYLSISGAQTFGFLRFTSNNTGANSSILITDGATATYSLFDQAGNGLNPPSNATILTAIDGADAGFQNDPTDPDTERERLMTHIIFSPVLKSANRTLTITYTLTISVARSA